MANHFGNVDNVILEEYNESYVSLFNEEKMNLSKILGDCVISIDHIGSTAIQGIRSKPVIDIAITTRPFPIGEERIKLLCKNSYLYWDRNPDESEQFFFKGLPRTHIVHIYAENHQKLKNQIFFRDYLVAHQDVAKKYEKLKIALAEEFHNDREKYTEMKGEFINSILKQAPGLH